MSFSFYPYNPSKVLPIFFAVVLFIFAGATVLQSIKYKWIRFGSVIAWASTVWFAGFIVREISAYHTSNLGLYIAQYVLVFVGPPLYAASEYFILGRLMAYLPYHAPLHPGRVLSTFAILSAAVEALAASGASASSSSKQDFNAYKSAIDRMNASLILQEVLEASFFALVAYIEYRCRKAGKFPRNVRIMCRVLYVTSLMMTIRCLLRTIQGFESTNCDPYLTGFKGYCGPISHFEWYLWVFEVANITVLVGILAAFHPGRYLPPNNKHYLDPVDGTTERVGPGYSEADSRPWIVTVLDPFDFSSRCTGKAKGSTVDKFWERDNPIAGKSYALV
jgi:hypothetical protein